jgi:hypothetical protein
MRRYQTTESQGQGAILTRRCEDAVRRLCGTEDGGRKTEDERIDTESVRLSSFVKFVQSKNSKIVHRVGLLADNSKSSLWASRLGWNSPSVGLGSGQLGKLVPRRRSKTGVGWGCDNDDRHLPCTLGVWRGETQLLRRAG